VIRFVCVQLGAAVVCRLTLPTGVNHVLITCLSVQLLLMSSGFPLPWKVRGVEELRLSGRSPGILFVVDMVGIVEFNVPLDT